MGKSYLKAAVMLSAAFLLQACSHEDILPDNPAEKTGISVGLLNPAGTVISDLSSSVDIFVFDNDSLQKLDSYQRIRLNKGEMPYIASQKGEKIVAVIMYPHSETYEWSLVSSFRSLQGLKAQLAKESAYYRFMSGYSIAEAGTVAYCTVRLTPLVSEIYLRSIRCDFAGKPYSGATLGNVKAYLVNVSSEARAFQEKGFVPESFCNQGRLVEKDVEAFLEPEIIVREIKGTIGNIAVSPKLAFYCYPNECKEESAGSPFTRLVIEGSINGQVCYYPININRDRTNTGISRNCRYIYDVTIRTTGTSDPDTAISPEDADITCTIVPWDEKENTEVVF